jgi:hypothetical protein
MAQDPGDGEMMILVALAAAAAQPADTPRAFMERLYANYRHNNYSSFSHPGRVFAPRLLAAINEDSKLAQGEVGYLDGDPVCDCQDYGRLRAQIHSLRQSGRSATAQVHLIFIPGENRDITLSLVRTRSGWRIADVKNKDLPSLLGALEKSNREVRAAKH